MKTYKEFFSESKNNASTDIEAHYSNVIKKHPYSSWDELHSDLKKTAAKNGHHISVDTEKHPLTTTNHHYVMIGDPKNALVHHMHIPTDDDRSIMHDSIEHNTDDYKNPKFGIPHKDIKKLIKSNVADKFHAWS